MRQHEGENSAPPGRHVQTRVTVSATLLTVVRLGPFEAARHPHNAARKVFIERHGVTQPAPAPRFSRTPSAVREAVLTDLADLNNAWRSER